MTVGRVVTALGGVAGGVGGLAVAPRRKRLLYTILGVVTGAMAGAAAGGIVESQIVP